MNDKRRDGNQKYNHQPRISHWVAGFNPFAFLIDENQPTHAMGKGPTWKSRTHLVSHFLFDLLITVFTCLYPEPD
jgi:hypothetical protein